MEREIRNPAFPRMIAKFCRQRASQHLPPREVELLAAYMIDLFDRGRSPPNRGRGLDWLAIADHAGVSADGLLEAKADLRPGFEALRRELRKPSGRPRGRPRSDAPTAIRSKPQPRTAGPKAPTVPRDCVAPEPEDLEWIDTVAFSAAFDLHVRRHHDTLPGLVQALELEGCKVSYSTLRMWRLGLKAPSHHASLDVLSRLERRWCLAPGYFSAKLASQPTAIKGHSIADASPSERRWLAWHLPHDFERRSKAEQDEILAWVQTVIISGSTEYRRFQRNAAKHRFAVRFPGLHGVRPQARDQVDPDGRSGTVKAPPALAAEMSALLTFKTATLTPAGYRRRGVWGEDTASQKLEHLGLMFGALAAPPNGPARGLGLPLDTLCFGMLVLPRVWDWYLGWREQRRGFFTAWEVDMLSIAAGLTSAEVGWITQTPALADRLQPVSGLIDAAEIAGLRSDWPAGCERLHRHAITRAKELARVARVHRDPFEPILAVLEAESPVGEYRKIADEVLKFAPAARRHPKAGAEAVRSFLLIRFGLHLGFRQKNLRQLLYCPRGQTPRTERQLSDLKRGELRWNEKDQGWEVFCPARAFKNADSSFFRGRPFRLILPNLGRLYEHVDAWIDKHRAVLLAGAVDPGTFFIKTVKRTSTDAAYCQTAFYEAWRWVIQRYGIFNPYTGRGAIPGLLPHGPHNVRDVLATHILKQTGSYEQASYAIQDTPDMVAQHYGRFLPQDKAALAAAVLNRAWEAA